MRVLGKAIAMVCIVVVWNNASVDGSGSTADKLLGDDYQNYMDFFEEVYTTVENNYYKPIDRRNFDRFIEKFNNKIYANLKGTGKSVDFIRWRSAAFLVEHLKDEEDVFTAFYPPTFAKQYEQKVLGKKIDVGIEGELSDNGYIVKHVEPRSNAYIKGLRARHVILKVDDESVIGLSEEKVEELFRPLEGETISITYLDETKTENMIEVLSEEYFHQTVFLVPLNLPDIFCLEIRRFNRKTSEDMYNYLTYIKSQVDDFSLILDLRGNPGGPPLAAREISAFFLNPGEEFAYFQKRDKPKSVLDVPEIPEKHRFKGPIVILVDEESGSASELFSGIMQRRIGAVLMGKNTAGKVFLKSMFHFDDESMVLLVVARGHHPDGRVFEFSGVKPDRFISDEEDIEPLEAAINYLNYLKIQKNN